MHTRVGAHAGQQRHERALADAALAEHAHDQVVALLEQVVGQLAATTTAVRLHPLQALVEQLHTALHVRHFVGGSGRLLGLLDCNCGHIQLLLLLLLQWRWLVELLLQDGLFCTHLGRLDHSAAAAICGGERVELGAKHRAVASAAAAVIGQYDNLWLLLLFDHAVLDTSVIGGGGARLEQNGGLRRCGTLQHGKLVVAATVAVTMSMSAIVRFAAACGHHKFACSGVE